MPNPSPRKLDYATPVLPRRFDPAVWPTLRTYATVVFIEAALGMTDGKLTPGGPFISISAEVLPVVLCVGVVLFGVRSLFFGTARRRVLIALLMLLALTVLWVPLSMAISYWNAPYSRGPLIGF
jgi:hypothetical protein